jgi:hypothetical protein
MEFIARATIFFNNDFYEFATIDQGMINIGSLDVETLILPPDATDISLGIALRQALKDSKEIPFADFQKIWKAQDMNKRDADRVDNLINKFGYKNKSKLYKNMRCCWVSVKNGMIQIQPTRHKSIDSYAGISADGSEIIYLSESVSDAELGISVREGFKRCIG